MKSFIVFGLLAVARAVPALYDPLGSITVADHASRSVESVAGDLDKRAEEKWDTAKVICSRDKWGEVNPMAYNEIVDKYENTWRANTVAMLPKGPRKCSKVACSYHTAFYVCNDNAEEARLDSFRTISDAIRAMWKRCGNAELHDMFGAQIFSPNNWNVIMEQDTC
ncbi:reverse transcriptase [Purpureocillium lavendulum]|uniref:Reverse transcriptase n=1 Tax=Purpureocillium lavendulum TaxID=1247861 RepID=A0AB34FGN0_9HYPO|nr:reverse transcriptase [Purpureocillium lavendulum]